MYELHMLCTYVRISAGTNDTYSKVLLSKQANV